MKRRRIGLLGVLVLISSLLGGSAFGAETKELRVCADPDNLPFSNQRLQGFENKIAELLANDLGTTLTYYWWPHQFGLVRRTLREDKCDVLIGIPKGYDLVLWTKPYYRTAYVLAYVKSKGFRIASLDDPILKQVKIGVYLNTPPYDALGERGITGNNVVRYSLFHDWHADQTRRPGRLMEDLFAGAVDVAILWGPMAGYFAKGPNAPPLELVPLPNSGPIPMVFDISMGVRKGDRELKARLEEALDRRKTGIRKILEDYGVPLLPGASAGSAPKPEPRAERQDPSGTHRGHE